MAIYLNFQALKKKKKNKFQNPKLGYNLFSNYKYKNINRTPKNKLF